MAFLKNIKQMFGFDDNSIYEDEKNNVNTEYKPYINPFKNEKQETANTAVAEDKKSEQTEADFDKAIHDEIKDKIIDIINASLPEFIKGCVDRDAELKYINEEFGTTFSTYTQNIRQAIEERAKSEWISERMNLEKQIEAMNLTDVVTLRGFVNNPYPWMKKADIIVCSSSYEGISTVVQEALILGKTVVTTMCTGMKELLGNSEYGIIANDGLVAALQRVLDSSALEQHYSIAAKKRGMDFYKSKIVRETERFLEENYRKKKMEP